MKKGRKYEFTGETMEFEGHTLRRIQYIRKFDGVYKDMLGGWIESEDNLSHEGNCRVVMEGKVFGNARVEGNGKVFQSSVIKDNAIIKGMAFITDGSVVRGDTIINGQTWIAGNSDICFYKTTKNRPYNIGGFLITEILNCKIEATGIVSGFTLKNKEYSGELNITNK